MFEGPETVAAVILEPVQNAGGCFVPPDGYFQRVREICDRYDVLMISDEVICAWGRLGHYFGCERFGYVPDIITVAKALTSAYAPMGGDDRLRPGRRAVHGGRRLLRPRLHLRRPPGRRGDRDGQPRRLRARGPLRPRARQGGRVPRRCSRPCTTCRSSATCAAPATSTRSSWSRTRRRRRASTTRSPSELLRGFLSGELYKRGLICRADDRGDPVIQLAPPLIADTEQFEEIHDVLHAVLAEAWDQGSD